MSKARLLSFFLILISVGINAEPNTVIPTGKIYLYSKSNFDGTREGNIAIYYRAPYEIESFKWTKGNDSATVVRAVIDAETLNVRQFEAYRLMADGTKRPGAELVQVNRHRVTGKIGDTPLSLNIEGLNWHSYDFDFASLAFAYRFLERKQDGLTFDIVDIDFSQGMPRLKVFGKVQMTWSGRTSQNGVSLLEFKIDGPGLDNRGGQIWFNEKSHELAGLKIEKPDETSYNSNLMRLQKQMDVSEEQWQVFKLKQLNSHGTEN